MSLGLKIESATWILSCLVCASVVVGCAAAANLWEGSLNGPGEKATIARAIPGEPGESVSDGMTEGFQLRREISRSRLRNVGEASWYGPGFGGKKTASGDIFDSEKLTAAHKTMPLGSKAKVTNLSNSKSVEVEINDRGPYIEGRIIDLSQAAAQALGMIDHGTTKVEIELLDDGNDSGKAASPNLR